MKKTFLVLAICSVIAACGGNSQSGSSDSTAATSGTAASSTVSAAIDTTTAGGKLIAKNDCLTCHKIDTKVIGPAYKDVAAKYPATEANIDTLANKVIHGGKGHWGDVPMASHPNLSVADAKTIVTYILSFKK